MSTPEDLKALEAIAAAQAAGQDPFGDDEPLTTEADADEPAPEAAAEPEAKQAAADAYAAEKLAAPSLDGDVRETALGALRLVAKQDIAPYSK